MDQALYIKLRDQIARQTPEAAALEAQAAALQPGIDSAQTWLDSCNAALGTAQAALTEAQAVEGADVTAQQEAVNAAQASVEAAKSDLSQATQPQKSALDHAQQIRAAMAQCQAAMDAGGIVMSEAEIDAAIAEEARLASIPRAVTMRQARLALLGAGLLSGVDAAIASMPEPTQSAAKIEWEYSQEVQRHNGFVAALGPALGMTDAQIDALFVAAAKL